MNYKLLFFYIIKMSYLQKYIKEHNINKKKFNYFTIKELINLCLLNENDLNNKLNELLKNNNDYNKNNYIEKYYDDYDVYNSDEDEDDDVDDDINIYGDYEGEYEYLYEIMMIFNCVILDDIDIYDYIKNYLYNIPLIKLNYYMNKINNYLDNYGYDKNNNKNKEALINYIKFIFKEDERDFLNKLQNINKKEIFKKYDELEFYINKIQNYLKEINKSFQDSYLRNNKKDFYYPYIFWEDELIPSINYKINNSLNDLNKLIQELNEENNKLKEKKN